MKCPKCHQPRDPEDEETPHWQCPHCGIAYDKFRPRYTPATPKIVPRAMSAERKGGFNFRALRITILLLVLAGVTLDSWLAAQRTTDWEEPLGVVVYPIAGDGSAEVAGYLTTLTKSGFDGVDQFFAREAARYGVGISDPMDLYLGPEVEEMPPLPPVNGSVFEVMWWSLTLRYWSMVMDEYDGPRPDIRVFVVYHRPEKDTKLRDSTGLQKGRVSIVHAFADERLAQTNNVVIVHEILHTLGATDKYDRSTGQPIFPEGYAEPDALPLFPQTEAEIMGAFIPTSASESVMPARLDLTRVGRQTAAEIGWMDEN